MRWKHMKFSQNTCVISEDSDQARKQLPATVQTPTTGRVGAFIYCFLSGNIEPEFSSVFHMILLSYSASQELSVFPKFTTGVYPEVSRNFAMDLQLCWAVSPKPPSGSKPRLQHFTFIWILRLCSANSAMPQEPEKSSEKNP